MNILFWNMHNKHNIAVTQALLEENGIDVAIFAEYTEYGIDSIVEQQAGRYIRYDGYGGCSKITLLAKKDYKMQSYERMHALQYIHVAKTGSHILLLEFTYQIECIMAC